jgi:hypothetical protein
MQYPKNKAGYIVFKERLFSQLIATENNAITPMINGIYALSNTEPLPRYQKFTVSMNIRKAVSNILKRRAGFLPPS